MRNMSIIEFESRLRLGEFESEYQVLAIGLEGHLISSAEFTEDGKLQPLCAPMRFSTMTLMSEWTRLCPICLQAASRLPGVWGNADS